MFQVWMSGKFLCEISGEEVKSVIGHFACFVDMPSRTVVLW